MALKALFKQLSDLDVTLSRRASLRGECLDTQRFFTIISRLGDGIFWYLLMCLICLLYGSQGLHVTVQLVAVGLVSLIIYKALKHSTGRRRPCDQFDDIRRHAPMLDLYSFPSGHTMHAVGFTAVVLNYFPTLGVLITPFVFLVASSRLVLGLHYPSDVIVGALIGGSVAWASFLVIA